MEPRGRDAGNGESTECCKSCGASQESSGTEPAQMKSARAGRLTLFLQENPRSGPRIILILSVALILVLAGMMAYALDMGQIFEPPYESEDGPLTLSAAGIDWIADFGIDGNYSCMRYYWETNWEGHAVSFARPLANLTDQSSLSSGSPAVVENPFVVITDLAGDGVFGTGDSILFKWPYGYPEEDMVNILALVHVDMIGDSMSIIDLGEYSWVVHDGKFYSWRSHELNAQIPWWWGQGWDWQEDAYP